MFFLQNFLFFCPVYSNNDVVMTVVELLYVGICMLINRRRAICSGYVPGLGGGAAGATTWQTGRCRRARESRQGYASTNSIWLYAHNNFNSLVNFTSDPIRCLALRAGRGAPSDAHTPLRVGSELGSRGVAQRRRRRRRQG